MSLVWLGAVLVAAGVGYRLFLAPRSQLFGRYPYRSDVSDRVVALTLDDGPNEPYTSQIADFLDRRGVRATFFQVGRCVERFPATTVRLAAAGHVVGNHSLTHRFSTYLRPRAFRREIDQTQDVLRERLGRTPALARSPWLWRQPMLLRMLRQRGLRPVAGVFCHPLEVFHRDGAAMARRAIAQTRPGTILIFHDGFDGRGGARRQTVKAVQMTVDGLLARGYRFVTVDELLGVPAYQEARSVIRGPQARGEQTVLQPSGAAATSPGAGDEGDPDRGENDLDEVLDPVDSGGVRDAERRRDEEADEGGDDADDDRHQHADVLATRHDQPAQNSDDRADDDGPDDDGKGDVHGGLHRVEGGGRRD
jgi:peptidoglycan/xylan/chitin deacetylase (PgdA/CDA1 family)